MLDYEFWMLDVGLGNGEADVGLEGERNVGCWFQFKIQHSKFKISPWFHGFSEVVLTIDVRIFWMLEAFVSRLSALSAPRMSASRAKRSQ